MLLSVFEPVLGQSSISWSHHSDRCLAEALGMTVVLTVEITAPIDKRHYLAG
jgi:hypothetical protein